MSGQTARLHMYSVPNTLKGDNMNYTVKGNVALKYYREKHQLTQKELAEKLGVTQGMYSLIEMQQQEGSIEFWRKFQKYFNIPNKSMWAIINYSEKEEI